MSTSPGSGACAQFSPLQNKAGHQNPYLIHVPNAFALAFGPSSCFFSSLPNACDFTNGPRLGTNPRAGDLEINSCPPRNPHKQNDPGRNVISDLTRCLQVIAECSWLGIGGKNASSRDSHPARVARCTIPLDSRRTMRGRLHAEPTAPESIARFRPFALCRCNVIRLAPRQSLRLFAASSQPSIGLSPDRR